MKTYKRKITYFYQYYNGTVGSTVGFLKLEIRGERVKVIINIQDGAGQPYDTASLYFYHEAGDHLAALKVDEIKNVEGVLTYHTRLDWQNFYQTGRDLYTFDGALVVYNGNHYYVGDFNDKDRKNVPIQFLEVEKKEPKQTPVNSGKRELEKKEIIFNVKSSSDGRTFGTISTKQISEKLTEMNYQIDKKKIKLDVPLNVLGTHFVTLNLHKKVECKLKVILK